jgi:hypothetical protein
MIYFFFIIIQQAHPCDVSCCLSDILTVFGVFFIHKLGVSAI